MGAAYRRDRSTGGRWARWVDDTLFDLARQINRRREAGDEVGALAGELRHLGGVLGLLQDDPERYLRGADEAGGFDADAVESLIARRAAARQARDWAEADRIRTELSDLVVVLEDGPEGTRWRRS